MKRILLIGIILTFIDQFIKLFVVSFMSYSDSIMIIKHFFSITLVHNTGAAFSILSTNTFFLILVGIIALFLIYLFFIKDKEISKKNSILYGMLIGGILGNLIDRIFRGYVVDFLDFKIFGYDYPVFNFADIFITISIIFIIIDIIRSDRNEVSSKRRWY